MDLKKILGFLGALVLLFALGLGAGRVIDPSAPGEEAEAAHSGAAMGEAMAGHEADAGAAHGGHGSGAADVRGLGVAAHGLRLVVADPERPLGRSEPLRFRVVRRDGAPLRSFELNHTKRMHLIVVRRDLTGFQHLHPRMSADGTWTAPLRLDAPGSYRLFADFVHDGTATTLAADLAVPGDLQPRPLPTPVALDRTAGGFEVRFASGHAHPGEQAELAFSVSRDGESVATEPYLGAGGHLVALREGDLAFLHVHPSRGLHFEATFPTAGRYRLFLQFKVDGRVETAEFTEVVR